MQYGADRSGHHPPRHWCLLYHSIRRDDVAHGAPIVGIPGRVSSAHGRSLHPRGDDRVFADDQAGDHPLLQTLQRCATLSGLWPFVVHGMLVTMSVPFALKEWYWIGHVAGGNVFSSENMARVSKVLPVAGFPE